MTGDTEPEPVIDLGERPPVGSDDDRPPAPRTPRVLPRHYLALAGAALLAVGFVGGIAVERAAAPAPAPTPTPAVRVMGSPVWEYPLPEGDCASLAGGLSDGRYITGICVGAITAVHGSRVTILRDTGGDVTFVVDDATQLHGADSATALHRGQHVIAHLTSNEGGPAHADSLVLT